MDRTLEVSDPTRSEARGARLERSVRRYYVDLHRSALRCLRRWRVMDPASSHEDLAQEAILRLLTRSPPAWRTDPPPLRALTSWVERCSFRLCVDARRRADRRGLCPEPDWASVRPPRSSLTPAEPPSPLDHLVARSLASSATLALRAAYPRGAELVAHLLAQPDATSEELAALMGTTPANVHQIRSRARRVLRAAGIGAARESVS